MVGFSFLGMFNPGNFGEEKRAYFSRWGSFKNHQLRNTELGDHGLVMAKLESLLERPMAKPSLLERPKR